MTDLLILEGLVVSSLCGALPEERVRRQPFQIDVEIEADLSVAGGSDDLDDTINYGAVTDAIHATVTSEQYTLLERMAQRVAEVVLEQPLATAATVTVRKLRPPVPELLQTSGVRIRRER